MRFDILYRYLSPKVQLHRDIAPELQVNVSIIQLHQLFLHLYHMKSLNNIAE